MKVLKTGDSKGEESRDSLFIGKVNRLPVVDEKMANELRVAVVTFSPGARNKWHTHTNEQVLYVTEGKGIVATEDEEALVTPGTIAFIPSGEKHWHGATSETSFSHLSIYTPGTTKVAE